MKEPKRLLSHGATDFERQLLRAVANERPSALLRSRMQRGLGLVGPLAWASTAKAMLGSLAGGVAGKLTSKLGVGVALGGVVAAGGIAIVSLAPSASVQRAATAEDVRATAAEAPEAPSAPAAAPATQSRPAETAAAAAPEPAANPAAAAVDAPATTEPVTANAAESSDLDGRLREEIALLDAARAALQRGDRAAARQSLSSYRERFADGVLRREAKVLSRRAESKRATSEH